MPKERERESERESEPARERDSVRVMPINKIGSVHANTGRGNIYDV